MFEYLLLNKAMENVFGIFFRKLKLGSEVGNRGISIASQQRIQGKKPLGRVWALG